MERKCPFCGSEEYECIDTERTAGFTAQDICYCDKCNKAFFINYKLIVTSIEKSKGE